MVILFLSFLNIDFKTLLRLDGRDPGGRALHFSLFVHAPASALAD